MLESWLAQLVADAPLRKCELIQIDIDLVKRAIDEIESLRGTIKIFRPPGATVARTTRCIRDPYVRVVTLVRRSKKTTLQAADALTAPVFVKTHPTRIAKTHN
jgi:hypothetical protein